MPKNLSSNFWKGIKGALGRGSYKRLTEGLRDETLEKLAVKGYEIFSYETLVAATNNFHPENRVSIGSFALVYKGMLEDGREIAVKKSSPISEQQMSEKHIRELELLTRVKHPNVVKLLGYCADDNECLLVFEYVPYESLDKHLFSPNGRNQDLDWTRTYDIILGIAKGLSYLQADPQNCIIHRDISPSNILLDHKWVPKIAGFGFGLLFDEDQNYSSIPIAGTGGYIAPECLPGHLSPKTDVYSFGIVVLELIRGKNFLSYLMDNEVNLRDLAYELFKVGKISEIMDPALANSVVTEQVAHCIKIALLCTQWDPNSRPDIKYVVSLLTLNEMSIGKPEFYGFRDSRSGRSSALHEQSRQPAASEEAAQSQDDQFEEVYFDTKISDYMKVDEHQIQDNPSNQIMKGDEDPQKGREDENLKEKIAAQKCQQFSYKTLYDATNHFASQNEIGKGGFGDVYKGKLDDGTEIAVKKSSKMSEKHRKALIREVELLSSVKHPNVVKLLGYCVHGNRCLLVYEYVLNNSLDKHLFDPNGRKQDLDWTQTYSMIISIAEGLNYLHVDPQNCIIHRDIKANNILLDQKWVPKIADFGISRLFDEDRTHVTTTEALGTLGYMAPEYVIHKHVSIKTDVYSFGVLVLEIVSGKRFNFMPPPPEADAEGLLDWAYTLFKAGKTLNIMDPGLASSAIIEQVANCIKIGLLCVQGNPKLRPDMESVLSMLTLNRIPDMAVGKPGIFGFGDRSGSPSNLGPDKDQEEFVDLEDNLVECALGDS